MKKSLIPVIIFLLLLGVWIARIVMQTSSTGKIILPLEQIQAYNASLLAQDNLHLVDIEHATFTAHQVRQRIDSYKVSSSVVYIDTDSIGPQDMEALYASRNMEAVPDSFIPRYGLTCLPACVRSFPTYQTLTDDAIISGPFCFDDNQQSQLCLGEGVMILHYNADSTWMFVQAYDYAGWVESCAVIPCSYDQMVDYLHPQSILVNTRIYSQCVNDSLVRLNMGTTLPSQHGRALIPSRDKQGQLQLVPMAMQGRWHRGYLLYTQENVLDLAMSQEGNPYDWGNRNGYNDCTAYVRSIYRCFGVRFPRNSSDFCRIERGAQDFDAEAVDWTTLPIGTILMTRSHAVLYLGIVEDEPRVIHAHCNTYHPETGETELVGKVECTPIVTLVYKDGSTLATSVRRQVEVK